MALTPDRDAFRRLPKDEKRAVRLAAKALTHALKEDWPAATRAVQAVNDKCGSGGIATAILVWSDTLIDYNPGTTGDGRPVRLAFMNADTGHVDLDENADAVPEQFRWAGRVIAARAAQDQPGWEALIDSLPDDPHVHGRHVGAVLEVVALTLRNILGGRSPQGGGSR